MDVFKSIKEDITETFGIPFLHSVSKKLSSIRGLKSDFIDRILLFIDYVELCCMCNSEDEIVTIINLLLLFLFNYEK